MTTLQVKGEIQKVLEKIPESILPDILLYLKTLESESSDNSRFKQNVKKILSEDRRLLERLAK